MNRFRIYAIFTLLGIASVSNGTEIWVPVVKFQLEDADYIRTLTWVSGFGYALDAVARTPNANNNNLGYCIPKDGYIGSKVLLEILNNKFAGQTITSEQATAEIMDKISIKYPCE